MTMRYSPSLSSRGVALAVFFFLLSACARPAVVPTVDRPEPGTPSLPATAPLPAEKAAVADQPLPEAVDTAAPAIAEPIVAAQEAVQEAIEAVGATTPPAPAPEDACGRAAASLIVRWEVTSPAYYRKRLLYPIWPGGASGVTWGVGYDGGHQPRQVILDDWPLHAGRERLAATSGVIGASAQRALPRYRDIPTAYEMAEQVFTERTIIEYRRQAQRAFRKGFGELSPNACGAIVSLVYNRGTSMTGDSRREMRNLRDTCIPKQDYSCIASELRSMKRLWRGTVNERGLSARREAEARLALMQ